MVQVPSPMAEENDMFPHGAEDLLTRFLILKPLLGACACMYAYFCLDGPHHGARLLKPRLVIVGPHARG